MLSKRPFIITGEKKYIYEYLFKYKKETKGRMVNIYSKTNNIIKGVTKAKSEDTNAELQPEQIGAYLQLYSNKKILFSKEELKKVRIMEELGLTLMGFKSMDLIKPYYYLRESYFIYPNELISKGEGKIIGVLSSK